MILLFPHVLPKMLFQSNRHQSYLGQVLEKLTLGGLRRAVVDGDVKTGSVMSGQIAGMVKDEKSCKEIIEQMMNEMEELLKGAPARL